MLFLCPFPFDQFIHAGFIREYHRSCSSSRENHSLTFQSLLHAFSRLLDILFNLLVQFTLCAQIEKLISTPFYAIVYFCGGIGGFLLGGNFGLVGQPAVGASGAIYACISVELVDLIYNWKYVSTEKSLL